MVHTEHPLSEMIAERWVGSLADIADIADQVLAAFREAGNAPEFFYVALELFDGRRRRTRSYDTVEDFRADLPNVEPDQVREATISAFTPRGPAPFDDQQIRVNFGRRVGVLITVQAPAEHEAFLDAAERRVNEAVERRELRLVKVDRVVHFSSPVLALIATFVLAFASDTAWIALGLVTAVAAAAVVLLNRATRWAFPPLEFVREGGASRARRVARGVVKVIAVSAYAVFLGVLVLLFLERLLD